MSELADFDIGFMRAEVPCGTCRQCCRGNSMVILLADEGDDVASYEHDIIDLPVAGRGPVLKRQPNGDCVYLGPNGCTIHDRAPVMCRIFDCRGLVRAHPRRELRAMVAKGLLDKDIVEQGRRLLRRPPA